MCLDDTKAVEAQAESTQMNVNLKTAIFLDVRADVS
jgi:hypothetical protein